MNNNDVIEVHDDITDKDFWVDPVMFREFVEANWDVDRLADSRDVAESEIQQVYNKVMTDGFASSDLLRADFSAGVYRGQLPDCGWVEEED